MLSKMFKTKVVTKEEKHSEESILNKMREAEQWLLRFVNKPIPDEMDKPVPGIALYQAIEEEIRLYRKDGGNLSLSLQRHSDILVGACKKAATLLFPTAEDIEGCVRNYRIQLKKFQLTELSTSSSVVPREAEVASQGPLIFNPFV